MAYISGEDVAAIRAQVKKVFPDFRFSIVREHHSVIDICVIKGPIKFKQFDGHSFNEYHPDYTEHPELRNMFEKIAQICRSVAKVEYRETGDYGDQPNYYMRISIGGRKQYSTLREGQ